LSKSILSVVITILQEIVSFLVSCRQTISGRVELITLLTESHLDLRFNPLTFHIRILEGSMSELITARPNKHNLKLYASAASCPVGMVCWGAASTPSSGMTQPNASASIFR
jgi:hypothetical protein